MANQAEKPKPVKVIKDAVNPEPDEILAKAIVDIDATMKRWTAGPLKRETLVLLISERSKYSKTIVRDVLSAMDWLKTTYLK